MTDVVPSKRLTDMRRALQLHQAGLSMWEVAEALGVAPATASGYIANGLKEAAKLVDDSIRHDILVLEMTRLDALQRAQWDNAMAGDVRATEAVLKIMGHRSKLLGLEDRRDATTTVQAVVVAGDSDTYVETLRRIAAGGA